ncbi:hypothetical protein L2E82_08105 [Cichorium intybus]|uniref:Uncharacterized protein n=1 Tax=Cichorium intybus TaxID=13427 RepID=A0ACB9G7I1_CICIN|nr:hypothetical protein L2E82_08105 [Cichorium intybus]
MVVKSTNKRVAVVSGIEGYNGEGIISKEEKPKSDLMLLTKLIRDGVDAVTDGVHSKKMNRNLTIEVVVRSSSPTVPPLSFHSPRRHHRHDSKRSLLHLQSPDSPLNASYDFLVHHHDYSKRSPLHLQSPDSPLNASYDFSENKRFRGLGVATPAKHVNRVTLEARTSAMHSKCSTKCHSETSCNCSIFVIRSARQAQCSPSARQNATESISSQTRESQKALIDLWYLAYPDVKLQGLTSEQWKDMGGGKELIHQPTSEKKNNIQGQNKHQA